MTLLLLAGALIVLACVLSNRISYRFGIPTLLAFIILGMVFGSDGIFKVPFEDYDLAQNVCSGALVIIMFYGGFGTNWKEARPVAGKAIVLSSLGVVLTSALTGLFCYFVLKLPLIEGLLLGSILGSTDAASVFSILRSRKMNLKYKTASLLEIESGSNDPFAYMLTIVFLTILQGGKTSPLEIAKLVGLQLLVGGICGVAIGFAAAFILKRFRFVTSGFDMAYTLAVAALSYALPAVLGGNGYLSTYLTGIILGNSRIPNKQSLAQFFDGTTGLMQMLTFFMLGWLSFPSQLPQALIIAVPVALFLTFIARPLAVFFLMLPFRCPFRQQLVISWCGLRGAASIVFAIFAMTTELNFKFDLYHVVFAVVLLSIAFQGTLLPYLSKWLKMTDDKENVLKTFNDYADETAVQFVNISITPDHEWNRMAVRELSLPTGLLLVLVRRDGRELIPSGGTVLEEGDTAVLAAEGAGPDYVTHLSELTIDEEHEWQNKQIKELPLSPGELIVLIRRGDKIVIPNGKTKLKEHDILVINRSSAEPKASPVSNNRENSSF